MIELIAMICAAVLVVWTPIEARKVAGGWIRKRHKGTPEAFRATYRRQLTILIWVGLAFSVFNIGYAVGFEKDPTRSMVKLVAGLLWVGAIVSAFFGRRIVDAATDAAAR